MFAMQYEHRLPADYDMQLMRDRAQTRGPVWEATPGLVLKAFVARERGRYGASANLYGGVYLWQDAASAARLLSGEAFRGVTDSFGRPRVETWLPLDARAGRADTDAPARTLYRESKRLAANADIAAEQADAVARNGGAAARLDTLAAWVALDPTSWELVWFTLSSAAPDPAHEGELYEVRYLARPGLAALANANANANAYVATPPSLATQR